MKKHPRRSRAAIEQLEQRQLLSLFLNNIDSENLGKGMWAWTLSTAMINDGFSSSNYSGWFSYLKNTLHLDYVITKAGNGDSLMSQYTTTVVNAAHAAGLKIVPYFYIYGDASDESPASHHSTQEAAIFNQVFNTIGGDFAVFDIESEYGDNDSAGITNYFSLIGKSQTENGTGSRDRLFMAYSSFDILHFHYTTFPCKTIADYCDAAMPQMYWKAHGYTVAFDLATTDADYKNTTYVGAAGVKLVIPTGQMYDAGSGLPTASETNSWYNAIKTDSSADGGTGAPAGWRYKSINYFDEREINASNRTEVAAETIGDLPGAPAITSPANGATNQSASGLVLNWSDVVNTYGTGSVGAAMYYDVYLDNMTTPATTISYSAPTAPVSQWTVPSTLSNGSHSWKIVARNMFGSTTSNGGTAWTFTVGGSAVPGVPDLRPETDSGQFNTDNRTNFNNSSVAKAPKFDVSGITSGATIKIYANGTFIGSAVAAGAITTVTCNGSVALPFVSGGYAITATQTEVGKTESTASAALTVTMDTGGPATPTTISAVPSGSAIFVDWNNSTAPDLWGYNIYRSSTSGGSYTLLNGATPLSSSDYTDSAVTGGQTYYYVAAGVDTAGNEANPRSAEVSATAATSVSAVPGIPDLDSGSDTGSSSTDNLTNKNNSTGNALQFLVGSTVADATIRIYSDGTLIGSVVATSSSTMVTTTTTISGLADGARAITATMQETGKNESAPTSALSVTVDTAAPTVGIVPVVPDPRGSGVSNIGINFNEAVVNFDRLDLTLARDGGADLLTGSQTVTSGDNTNFTLNTLSTLTNPTGSYSLNLTAAGSSITDLAGNALTTNASDAFDVRVITGTSGHDIFRLEPAGGNSVNIFVNNNTASPDYTWTIPVGEVLRISGLDGNDALTIYGPLGGNVSFDGGTQSGGEDSILVVGNGAMTGSYTPGNATGAGTIAFGADTVQFTNVEPVGVNSFASFSLVTPGAADVISIDNPTTGTNRISGTSGGVAFSPLHITDVGVFTLDSGANDGAGANDTVTIDSPGIVATSNFNFIGAGGQDTLNVNGGTLGFNADASATTSNLTLNVGTGAAVNFNASQHLQALNLSTGSATLVAGGSKVLVVNTLSATSGGTLDLTDNDLIVTGMSYSPVQSLVKSGFGTSNWLGTGITSSTAAGFSQTDGSRMLGVVDNAETGYTTFSGETVSGADILVKFTYIGDSTLDGKVNADDFSQFIFGFSGGGSKLWVNGDNDYNGLVNADDFNAFLSGMTAFNANGSL